MELYRTPSAEQITLVDCVTETLLIMLVKQLLAEGSRRQLSGPFELFELNNSLCDLLGLERGRVIMLELTGDKPDLIWADDDLRDLRARDVADLRRVAAGLETIRWNSRPFMSLMADTPEIARRG